MKKIGVISKLSKVGGSKALGAVVSVASLISMVDEFVSGQRKTKEFVDLKDKVSNLEKIVSELQKKN